MCVFQFERRNLDELLQSELAQEEAACAAGDSRPQDPFDSSRKMFEYIKESVGRCSAYSNGQTLSSLGMEFRICLNQYAESLSFRCPTPIPPSKPGGPVQYSVSDVQEITLCRVIKTGEYCADVIPQLESLMRNKIRSSMASEVDFNINIDKFHDLCSKTIQILVVSVINRLEIPFKAMRRINWGSVETLGETSE